MNIRTACLVACGLAWAGMAAAQEPGRCAITALEGDGARVELGGAVQAVALGPLPGAAARLLTGPATRLEITCRDGLVLTVGPECTADLGDLLAPADERSVVVALIEGIIGIVVPDRGGGTVEVRTPAAIAAVRSTAWLVEHDPEVGTAVFVREGRVTVSNRETAVVLREGEGITLTRDSTVRPAAAWGPPRIEQATALLGLGWD
jgi:ferric-dicitrate binding protein FerR (iron transport regulator)